MSARRVNRPGPVSEDALRLRAILKAAQRPISDTDPLKLRREKMDRELRELRSQPRKYVNVQD